MNIIKRFYASRPEQRYLRQYLLNNFDEKCMICRNRLPTYLLECSHIKPRRIMKHNLKDLNNVLLLCKSCHSIFDNGDIAINNDKIEKSKFILNYDDLKINDIDLFEFGNDYNIEYLKYHYKHIFKK